MATPAVAYTLYANYLSQPSRAILWAAAMKKLPMTMKKTNPVGGEAETPDYLAKFPSGFVPALEVVDADTKKPVVCLTEAGAILQYLSEANQWSDLYPSASSSADIIKRARVQQWMHWQHTTLRRVASKQAFEPMMLATMRKLGASTKLVDAAMEASAAASGAKKELSAEEKAAMKAKKEAFINQQWKDAMLTMTYGGLKEGKPFLASADKRDDQPTIADLLLYCEIDQVHYAGLYDFGQWPEVREWMRRMEHLPEHDSVRRTLFKFLEARKQ